MDEPTADFYNAFGSGIGGPSIHCSCGRQHHAPGSNVIDEREEREMRDEAAKDPKRVVLHDDTEDAVSALTINGMVCVHGCPCNWLRKFEDLLWNERDRVLRYYRLRRERDAKALAELDSALSTPGNGH